MKKIFLLFSLLIGASINSANARTYTSVCDGDIELGKTWGVDPENFQLHDDDVLIINHELYIYTKYLAPDIEVGNLTINAGGKVLIKFSGDEYSTARGLNVHGNLVNYGCLGFDRLGSFSNNHDNALAGGYGRLWLSLWGNLENHGIINTNSLYMKGKNQTINSTEKIQISEFCPKFAQGNIKALSDITFYNTQFSRWAGAIDVSEFDAFDMDGHTLTLTADAPSEPDVWWYSPEWNGHMSDMKIRFGKTGKLVVNNCYVSNNEFYGDNIQVASDSHGFFVEHNTFNGNVDLVYGNLHICCTNWIDAFEVIGNLVNHASVNSAEIVYPGKGVNGTNYHMLNVGDKGGTHRGDILVNGNFENLGSFGLGYIYDIDNDAHTSLRMYTLGKNITIKGEITAEVNFDQVHPIDDYNNTYNTYDGKPLAKKGSISVKDFLKINRYTSNLNTTLTVPENASLTINNDLTVASKPINVLNENLNDERGLWNGLLKVRGSMTANWKKGHDDMPKAQRFGFPEWARWSFDGNDDFWQAEDKVESIVVTECGKAIGHGFASRSWEIKILGQSFNTCLHDLTLYYDNEDLGGLNENNLHIFQSLDGGKSWHQVSNDAAIIRDLENNKITACSWDSPAKYWINNFGIFALADPSPNGITTVQMAADAMSDSTYDLMGRKVDTGYKGIILHKGQKYIIRK